MKSHYKTLLCEMETVVISIPLLPCSNDPSNFGALTPNYFSMKKLDKFSRGGFNENDILSRKKLNQYSHIHTNFRKDLKSILHR